MHVRGSLVTLNNLFIAGGQAVAAIIAGLFTNTYQGWRYVTCVSRNFTSW